MGGRWIIEAMVLILSASVVMIIWPGMRRFLSGLIRNSALGLAALWLCGVVLGAQFQVGLNLFSAGICGLLGLPGTAVLVALKGFLL